MTDLDLAALSETVNLSPDGLLQHNLDVLQALSEIAAVVNYHVEVELRPVSERGERPFILRHESGLSASFGYEEALAFIVDITNRKGKELADGTS